MPNAPNAGDLIERIQALVASSAYRVGIHAVRHMVEEGFDENQMVEALKGRIRLLEEYPDEHRYLLLGRFHFTSTTTSPLHVMCDLSAEAKVDIVTAYIPQRPWWVSPTQRGRKK
ncbi:MAG: DUF4258 domain-containing protein [Candidatus Binatia bacterium]